MTTPPSFVVVDLFCGAGGSSTGALQAITQLGATMKLAAVNHWQKAIDTHQLNHPNASHYIQDVETADPEIIVPAGHVDLLMASPECRHHSRARGGKPSHDQQRMGPWTIQRWLTTVNVTRLLVENVPEFTTWGPLDEQGRPIKARAGDYFEAWLRAIWDLGYQAEWRFLNAADYGEATSRVRFFLQARNDGKPIIWPEPTHVRDSADGLFGKLPRWRGAREIIDWNDPGRSLLDDPKYQARPLALNTRRRIAKGIARYTRNLAGHYLSLLDLPAEERQTILDSAAMPTQADTADADHVSDHSHQSRFTGANRNQNIPRGEELPIPTITTATGGGIYTVQTDATLLPDHDHQMEPIILSVNHTGSAPTPQADACRLHDVEAPLPVIATRNGMALAQPMLVQYYGNSDATSVADPLPTVTTKARHALARPDLKPAQNPKTVDPRRMVIIDGRSYLLDIRFRMLHNHELARAMGFDDTTAYTFSGNKAEITRQIGNAVPVKLAAALVHAMFSEP